MYATFLWTSLSFPKICKPLVVYLFYCMPLFHFETDVSDKLNYGVEFENHFLSYDINKLALLTNIRTFSYKTIAAKYTYQRK